MGIGGKCGRGTRQRAQMRDGHTVGPVALFCEQCGQHVIERLLSTYQVVVTIRTKCQSSHSAWMMRLSPEPSATPRSRASPYRIVEGYLAAVADEPSTRATADAPVLRSVRGVLKKADVRDYKRHLAAKYRPATKHRLTTKHR